MDTTRIGSKLLLAGLSVVVFLGAAELISRIAYDPLREDAKNIFEYDPEKWFRLKANFHGKFALKPVVTNSHGHRDREIPVEKPSGTRRILVLGDSISFGHAVRVEESYPDRLENLLNDSGRGHFDVINTAAPGNAPHQEYVDLRRGLRFEPDTVLLQFTLNDVVEPYWTRKRLGGTGIDYHDVADLSEVDYRLSRLSGFYLFLKDVFARIRLMGSSGQDLLERARTSERISVRTLIDEPDDPEVREAWSHAFASIEKIVSEAKDSGSQVAIMITPFEFQLASSPEQARPQRILERFAAEHGVVFIDVLARLQEHYTGDSQAEARAFWQSYFRDNSHLNPDGHAWLAKLLFDELAFSVE